MNTNAFQGSEEFRKQMIQAADNHERLDHYMAGTYGEGVKACSVGCSIRSVNKLRKTKLSNNSHSELADELGVPVFITRLQDRIFEGLPADMRPAFTGRLFRAISAGADLSGVLPLFLLRVLDGLPELSRADVVAAVKGVKQVLQNWADTGTVDVAAANAAAYPAYAAYAAYAAANAANAAANAAYAAANAANAAAYAAANAAANAANAAANAAAYAAYVKMADDLIDCIKIVCSKQGLV